MGLFVTGIALLMLGMCLLLISTRWTAAPAAFRSAGGATVHNAHMVSLGRFVFSDAHDPRDSSWRSSMPRWNRRGRR
jgi:hypothetical protein